MGLPAPLPIPHHLARQFGRYPPSQGSGSRSPMGLPAPLPIPHHLARQFGRYPPSHKASSWQARLCVNYGVAGFFSTSDTNAS